MHPEVKALIDHFGFKPLPVEGTLYVETYRSAGGYGTAMLGLYCAEPRSVSTFHRLTADEVWHFYAGDPLRLILLYPDGSSRDVVMGSDPLKGQQVQFVVPAGVWQAGGMLEGGRYSLYGCTVAPGFTGDIFEGGRRADLIARYPSRAEDILMYSSPEDGARMPEGFAS